MWLFGVCFHLFPLLPSPSSFSLLLSSCSLEKPGGSHKGWFCGSEPWASDGLLRPQYFPQIRSEPRGRINSASCFGGDHLTRGGVLPRQEGPGVPRLRLSRRAHGQGCILFTPCLRVTLSSVRCLALPFLSNVSTCLILHTVVCLVLCACGGYVNGIIL